MFMWAACRVCIHAFQMVVVVYDFKDLLGLLLLFIIIIIKQSAPTNPPPYLPALLLLLLVSVLLLYIQPKCFRLEPDVLSQSSKLAILTTLSLGDMPIHYS